MKIIKNYLLIIGSDESSSHEIIEHLYIQIRECKVPYQEDPEYDWVLVDTTKKYLPKVVNHQRVSSSYDSYPTLRECESALRSIIYDISVGQIYLEEVDA